MGLFSYSRSASAQVSLPATKGFWIVLFLFFILKDFGLSYNKKCEYIVSFFVCGFLVKKKRLFVFSVYFKIRETRVSSIQNKSTDSDKNQNEKYKKNLCVPIAQRFLFC
jgi:hypothetical protein